MIRLVAAIVILLAGVGTTLSLLVVFDVIESGISDKTLWQWMEVWGIPVLVAILGGMFLFASQRTRERVERERQVANDRTGETATQAYIDSISSLVREDRLSELGENDPVRALANARTHAVLRGLDGARKGVLLRFINQLNLIRKSQAIISLETADLNEADLREAVLPDVDLEGANLISADLVESNLSGANLSRVDLTRASMFGADLSNANLHTARLIHADMNSIDLNNAHMEFADLSDANLFDANLSRSNLRGADLTGASMFGVNLSEANLIDALVSDQQLKRADNLVGATMPDGTEMTGERWEAFTTTSIEQAIAALRRIWSTRR